MDFSSWLYLAVTLLSLLAAVVFSRLLPLAPAAGGLAAFLLSLFSDLWYLELSALLLLAAVLLFLLARLPRRRETDLEAMVGRACTVTERIAPLTGGQVMVDGGLWAARGLLPELSYEAGTVLTVVAIEGVKLICR